MESTESGKADGADHPRMQRTYQLAASANPHDSQHLRARRGSRRLEAVPRANACVPLADNAQFPFEVLRPLAGDRLPLTNSRFAVIGAGDARSGREPQMFMANVACPGMH